MAKVEGPMFADEATGRVGQAASFKKGAVWNSLVPQFHRTPSLSKARVAARSNFSECVNQWKALSSSAKQFYNDESPQGYNGYQYFIGICIDAK